MSQDINWKSVDLNLLVTFSALFDTQSVSEAAKKLHVSQSAMSHSLARLRILLGDPLFERQGHKMKPSERATQIAPIVARLLNQITSEVLIPQRFSSKEFNGVCRIGLTDYAEYIFSSVLFDVIHAQSPQCQISFVNVNRSNYIKIVEEQNIDLVIGSFNDLDSRFSGQRLYTERHVCLFDPTRVTLSEPIQLSEYAQAAHALVSPDGVLDSGVDKTLAQHGLSRHVAVASSHFLTIRQLLSQRNLLAIVPEKMAQISGFSDALKVSEPPLNVGNFDIVMAWPTRKNGQEKSRWLRGVISQALKDNEE
ncbi:LysR family transcriptional regulator [Vibrio tapetis]|uniref:Putative transcriptional regulator, LysR family n=1 Tax=Vibrio tapetis subsp. tapetis TaxID=1671868 RepID=A0A2N8ZC65_9VIBR|nr:LysR family transcriptional regulator [Vibrio tapetis]SON49497.1 putative transcriptional regulator, LysR family [Vibrio tapetis subsp. tapetis]